MWKIDDLVKLHAINTNVRKKKHIGFEKRGKYNFLRWGMEPLQASKMT